MPLMEGIVRQLVLDLPHSISFRSEDFLPSASNQAALALVETWPVWPGPVATIIGPAGSGKSHLAAMWAERSGARMVSAAALDADAVPAALVTGAVAIEDVAPGLFNEPALFHLLNLAREERAHVLLTARRPLAGPEVLLPDLASRLRAAPAITLGAPEDELLAAVLVKLFADRQIELEDDVVAYLVQRMERSLAAAQQLVCALDAEALARGRKVTRILAGEIFSTRNRHIQA